MLNSILLATLIGLARASPCKPSPRPTTPATVSVATSSSILSSATVVVVDTTAPVLIGTTTEATESTALASKSISAVDFTTSVETTSIPAGTSTSAGATTASATSQPTACAIDAGCVASGWNVDYYSNVFEEGFGNDDMTVPASYYITEGLTPLDTGVTDETYFAQDYMEDLDSYEQIFPNSNYAGKAYYVGYQRTLNGDITVDGNNFTLVYQGYYQAPSTGTYELCIQADNANTLYFGDGSAFNCGTGEATVDAPALVLTATGYHFNNPIRCGTVDLIKGHNYPVRNVMGNKNAVSMFEFTIKAPGETATHSFDGRAFPLSCGVGL